MEMDKDTMIAILATNLEVMPGLIGFGSNSPILNYTTNITARTMFSDIVKISDKAGWTMEFSGMESLNNLYNNLDAILGGDYLCMKI